MTKIHFRVVCKVGIRTYFNSIYISVSGHYTSNGTHICGTSGQCVLYMNARYNICSVITLYDAINHNVI